MPRPPVNPRPGLWRMGAQLCINRVWKSRSISAAIFVVCLWVCLVSVINLASNGRPLSWTMKDDTFPSVPLAFPDTLDLITDYYRPVSRVKQSSGPNSRIQLKASTYLTQNGQTDEAIENGRISGRRMQEIKAVEMEGLETVSRVQEKDHAERDLGNILISAVQDQIDGKAITAMGIKQEIKRPRENPKDLPSNWTQEPETKLSPSSLSNVNGFDRSGSEDEPKPDRVISFAKHKLSELVGTDRKTRSAEHGKTNISEVADMTLQPDSIIEPADISKLQGFIGTRVLDKGGNSLSNHLLQSIGESHYLQGNFYHRARNGRVEMRIDTRLNGTKMYTPRKIEGSTYSYSSRTPDTASSHSESPQANSDGVKNTHRSEVTQGKSNREIPVAMQMLAPIRIEDFSPPLNVIDRKRKSMTRQIDSGAKHPTLFYPPDDRNGQTASLIQHRVESNSSSSQEGDVLKFALNANNLSRPVLREIRLSAASSTRSNQLSVSGTSSSQQSYSITYSLVNLTSGEPRSRKRRPDKKKSQQGSLLFDGFELYSYNVTASDMISLDRSIPDTRPEGCSQFYDTKQLPNASVIICFHNEAVSVLLRTVHSILDRSPAELLDKIILVDDNSTIEDLQSHLVEELAHLSNKILLTRTSKREGLVRARLLGAELATSDVIIFLDAHCECNVGWLEPLLSRLYENPQKVVTPYIDTIKAENFQYKKSPERLRGGFNWRLEFGWRSANVGAKPGSEKDAIITPVISGGLFAIWRDYFKSIGSYDPELDIWGGENFELSFKTWMCGGSLQIIPCSRVGHVFRASLPYSFSKDREEVVLRNLGRVASVWMDEYADTFYAAVNLPEKLDLGDISPRIQLRKKLKCHSFDWYLKNIFPQLDSINQETLHYGMVRNQGSLMCLDVLSSASDFYIGLSPCHGGKNQTFNLTSNKRLSQAEACIKPGINKQLTLSVCTNNMSWVYQNGFLRLDQTELCLTSVDNEAVQLLPCDFNLETNIAVSKVKQSPDSPSQTSDYTIMQTNSFQKWTFDYAFNWKRRRRRN